MVYDLIKHTQCYFLRATVFIGWIFLLFSAISNVLVLFQNMIKQSAELFDTALLSIRAALGQPAHSNGPCFFLLRVS